jgi:spore germination protein
LIVVAAVAVFGAEEIKNLLWPTLELAKTTSLPANVLERLDAAFLAVWVTAVFTTLFSSYYITVCALAETFRLKDHRMFSYFMLPFVTAIAMIPQNVIQMYEIIAWVGKLGLLITIAYPGLLLVIALFRGKRGGLHAS